MSKQILLLFALTFALVTGRNFTSKASQTLFNFRPYDIEYSPDQSFLAAADKDGHSVKIYNGHNLKQIQTINLPNTQDPQRVEFSHNSQFFAIGDTMGNVKVYGRSGAGFTNEPIDSTSVANSFGITGLAFTNDDSKMIVGDFVGNATVWVFNVPSTYDAELIQTYGYFMASDVIEFDASVIGLTVGSVSGNLLIGGGDNQVGGRMRLYDASNNYALLNDFPVQSVVQSVAFASDESFFLSSGNLGRITFWNSQTYANQSVLVPGTVVQVLYEVLVTDNSLYIAAAGNSNAYSWQRASIGAAWTENTPIPSDVENIALSPTDGLLLVVAGSAINEYSLCSTKQFYSSADDNCVACPKDECQECYGTTGQSCYGCRAGYYLNDVNCLACQFGCLVCEDGASCTTCDTVNHWVLSGQVCECEPAYFKNPTNQCQACVVGCTTCVDGTSCQLCDGSKGFIPLNNVCACPARTRLNGGVCTACGLGCISCDALACTNCDAREHFISENPPTQNCQCDAAGQWVLDIPKQQCVCINGFFENKNATCEACPLQCGSCISRTNCTACGVVPGTVPAPDNDGRCGCVDTAQFIDYTVPDCDNCNTTVPYCSRCNGANQCYECDPTLNRRLKNGTCACDNGFFLNQTTQLCDPCEIPGCLTCASTQECIECDIADFWVDTKDKRCICMTRHVQINNLCEECASGGCDQCVNNDTAECVECSDERGWDQIPEEFDCACKPGRFYPASKGLFCQECEWGCEACIDAENCTTCYPGFNEDAGDCFCDKGSYKFNKTDCAQCVAIGCEDCSDIKTCVTCYGDYNLNVQNECVCRESKSYPDGTKCSACQEECQTCTGIDKCLTCADGYTLEGDICEKDGLSVLIIILIVVGALVLVGVIFAVLKYLKKKKSPLEEEGDYEPVE